MRSPLGVILLPVVLLGCGDDQPGSKDGSSVQRDLFPSRPDQPPVTGCSPSTCSGCCQNQSCVSGVAASACGFAGNLCQACQSKEQCQSGVCVGPKCDPQSCASGCCDATGACKNGTTDEACGTGGGSCAACPTDQACKAGKCSPKGTGSYKVTVVSATITDSWTVCGWSGLYPEANCDPYVVLTVGQTKGQSSTKIDNHKPAWNEQLLSAPEADLLASFHVEVMDEDTGPDETIGDCYLKVTTADLTAGKLVQNCGKNVFDLSFEFQPF
jgi:hypothetical protein